MSLRTTNLNLLPILRALLKEASVSRAAAQLCLSQPATSNALNRLRTLLQDPLLVQVGRSMHLSPRAKRLLPLLDEACVKIDALLHEASFDPAETRRAFSIEAADYVELLLGGPLIKVLAESAPFASVNFTYADGSFREKLAAGEVDLAILAWDPITARGFSAMHGYHDRMVGVVNSTHPLARNVAPTAAALRSFPQVGVEPRFRKLGAMTSIGRGMRKLLGYQRVGAESFMLLPLLAAQSDCVAMVPKALADQARQMASIVVFELPGDPILIDAGMLWSPIYESDPAHRWFRGVVDAILRERFGSHGERRRATKTGRRVPNRRSDH